jgi:hypothetical protein
MIPFELLLEHGKALLAVWAVVFAAGIPVAALLRQRLGVAGRVLTGIVAWTVALYVIPFEGGLDVAMVAAVVGTAWVAWHRFRLVWRVRSKRCGNLPLSNSGITVAASAPQPGDRDQREEFWTAGLLFLGCSVYATLLLWNYVPLGVDAGMVGTSARMIALHRALPQNYDPLFPELFFPTVNLGLPTIGSIAIRLGCEPASVVLALAQLSYSAWILAAYLMLRSWVRPAPAAVLAVVQAWGARWAQNTIGWGGFPTVAGMAVGLFAVRLLWDTVRHQGVRPALSLGLTVGAIPLVHGVSAAVWLYVAAPVMGLVLLWSTPQRGRTLATLAAAAGISLAVLGCYVLRGQFHMSQFELDWSLEHLRLDAPEGTDGPALLLSCLGYLIRYSGSLVAWLGAASVAALVVVGRWRSALALLAGVALLVVLLANAQWSVLPFSMMLYPNRAVYWGGPLAAAALALAWQAVGQRWQFLVRPPLGIAVSVLLLAAAFSQHIPQYQKAVWERPVGKDGWEALRWAHAHLQPRTTFILAGYGSVGSYLPACAGLPTSAWEIHHCAMEESRDILGRLPPTHRLIDHDFDNTPVPPGRVLFQNATVVIVELKPSTTSLSR